MTVKEAMGKLTTKYPDRKIMAAFDYDSNWFIFSAPKNSKKIDMESPYFAVHKRTGSIRSYSPMADLARFKDAAEHRMIKI